MAGLPRGKWGVAYTCEVPLVKRGVTDFAVSADFTPASGDVKIDKDDAGSAASITTLPTAVTMGNGAVWKYSLSASEMQATSKVTVTTVDAATKAVEDQCFTVEIDYGIRSNTAQAGASSTITLDSSASATDNFYAGEFLEIIGGTGVGQVRRIASYVGSTKVATVDSAWATNPDSTSIFRIGFLTSGNVNTTHIASTIQTARDIGASVLPASGSISRATFAADTGLQTTRSNTAQAGANGTITLDASASSVTNYYLGQIIYITGGTGVGQSRPIISYDGSTKVATVSYDWKTNPDNTSTFAILPPNLYDLHYAASAIDTVDSRVIDLGTQIGTAGSGLTSLGDTRLANLDATVNSRLASASYTAPDNSTISSISSALTTLAAKFAGITLIKHWLGMLAGKQAADATALTEIKATGAGSGTYDPTTDSLEANRDNIGTAGASLTSADDAVIAAIAALNNLSSAGAQAAAAAALAAYNAATVGAAMTLTSGERNSIADAYLDRANGIETGYTPRQSDRLILAAATGKLSGAATSTVTIRDINDTKDRITATVDSNGNRTAVTKDAT